MSAGILETKNSAELTREHIRDFYDSYYSTLDDVQLEQWPDFFTAECLYRIMARENYERGFVLGAVQAESRGMLMDRVTGLMRTQMYAPRYYRRFPGPLRILDRNGESARIRQNLLIVETRIDRAPTIALCGICHDLIVEDEGKLRFRERVVVYDSEMITNSLIYPA